MTPGAYSAAARPAQRGKPAGGFVFIRAVDLCRLWQAYREGTLKFGDLRRWFAAQEVLARRFECASIPPHSSRVPHFELSELQELVGGSGHRAAVRRLEAAGLLIWSEHSVRFPKASEGKLGALPGCLAMLSLVTNHKRLVPVPRRTLRLLAHTGKPVTVATMLGHLLRCLYYRDGEPVSWGTCKASWIAETFGVDLRNVKRARRHLLSVGWLEEREAPRWHRQRWGGSYVVNLGWSRPESYTKCASIPPHSGSVPLYSRTRVADEPATKSPPPPALSTAVLPPPCVNRNLPSESKNQEPAAGRRAGVSTKKGMWAPNWRHVQAADLRNDGRLLELFRQACELGQAGRGERSRLLFFTAAEHALVKGTRNPAGLFAHLVRQKLWHFCTQDDEDAARLRLKRVLYGVTPERPKELKKERKIELSDDARLARAVDAVASRNGTDPLYLLRRMGRDWTREQFEEALGQAEDARLRRLAAAPV